jgi:chemotaxis signal transduction protein
MERYCVFNAGSRRVAIPLSLVRETLAPASTSPLVLGPYWLIGLFSVRGQVIPIVDLRSFIGGDVVTEAAPATHFVLVEQGDFRIAIPASGVGTALVDTTALQPHPESAMYPALEAEITDAAGCFHVVHLDRLEATLGQALGFHRLTAA